MNKFLDKMIGGGNNVPSYMYYYMLEKMKYGDEHTSLFQEYLDKYSSYKKDTSIDFTNDANYDLAKSVLENFYSHDEEGTRRVSFWYNFHFFNHGKRDLILAPDFDASSYLKNHFLGVLNTAMNYYPFNTEATILQAVYEIESHYTELLLLDENYDSRFLDQYPPSLITFCSVFSMAKTKEMALRMLEDDRLNKKNVIDTMNLMLNGRIEQIERYLEINDDFTDMAVVYKEFTDNVNDQINGVSSGYGEILSSTIVDLCEGDPKLFDDIQKFVFDKGPGYYPEIYQDLGVSREEVIENSGKVLRKIFDN